MCDGWPDAFRGSAAVTAGLVTRDMLRGPRYVRVLPDTYVPAGTDLDLTARARVAYRWAGGRGIVAGYGAAELLGASCGPRDALAELVVAPTAPRAPLGVWLRRDRLEPDEIVQVAGLRVTSPVRTAYDLARRGAFVERVVAVDTLARTWRFAPDRVLLLAARHRGARGTGALADVATHADARSGSPMETRLRLLLVLAGLPRPQAQWPVQDPRTRTAVWLDLAYPEAMLGIEYEGAGHTTPDAVLRDAGRYTALVDAGWRILRYTRFEVLGHPERIVEQVRRALSGG
jgi:hypothetical protein